MAALLKRLLTVGLALAFLVGVTAQLMPSNMAEPQTTVSAEMGGGCAGPHAPCTGHMPNCLDPNLSHFQHMEEVSFTYKKIEWTFVDGGILAEDDWTAPA